MVSRVVLAPIFTQNKDLWCALGWLNRMKKIHQI
jgi:hypothetical protein